ncbi:hypothetical protein QFC20_005432 [Naganishia adeliensis]|uniref:Uncharacterized protein n=1 Tax=Naganishia adeliensis TaxID=92952 RepID=A0ACC2VNJ6_9TREE|nr:hypothetical protein QFC20_005432 [Naganishia adeliensis]
MKRPSIKDRGGHTKLWRATFSPVSVRATLQEEADYVESAVGEPEQLLEVPRELWTKDAGYLHQVMRQLGVEPPLDSHEGDMGVAEVGVRDWMASVCEDLEGIMAEAIEAGNLIGEAGIEEEVLDQEALYGHMGGMVRDLGGYKVRDIFRASCRLFVEIVLVLGLCQLTRVSPVSTCHYLTGPSTTHEMDFGIELTEIYGERSTMPGRSVARFPASSLPDLRRAPTAV